MSTNKLTIIPVKLDLLPTETSSFHSSPAPAALACVIKTAVAGVDERVVQTIMKELKSHEA